MNAFTVYKCFGQDRSNKLNCSVFFVCSVHGISFYLINDFSSNAFQQFILRNISIAICMIFRQNKVIFWKFI